MYKKYMLLCEVYDGSNGLSSDDPDAWKEEELYFDTQEELVEYVKDEMVSSYLFKFVAAFRMEQLDSELFL